MAYDRFSLRLNEKGAGKVRDSVDCVGFANFETIVTQADAGKKAKAWDGQKRILYVQRTAGYDAKNRYGILKPLSLDWCSFDEAATSGKPIESIKAEIVALCAELTDETIKSKVMASFEKAKDNGDELDRILNKLRTVTGG